MPVPAPPAIVESLEAMNARDCTFSKRGDTAAWVRTLAPEYVDVEASGDRTSYAAIVASLKEPASGARVTACSSAVTLVTVDDGRYYVYGTYAEEGIAAGLKHAHYRSVQRFRDTWRRENGRWLQTESRAYEQTIWVGGKVVAHSVLH